MKRPQGVKKRDDIQGLRAVAVLMVIGFHINKEWLPSGFIGVDIFFVISGFLMTTIIVQGLYAKDFSLVSFYKARVKRIVPAYMVAFAASYVVAVFFLVPDDFFFFQQTAQSSLWFGTNIHFQQETDYFAPASTETPLLHLWSLAIEMQFYLFFPIAVAMMPRRFLGLALTLVTIFLFGWSVTKLLEGPDPAVYFSLLARAPEFLVGALAALFGRRHQIRGPWRDGIGFVGVILIAVSLFILSEESAFPGALAIPVTLGTGLIIAARPRFLRSVLEAKPMTLIGDMSYSLYLWHWPVLAFTRYYLESYELPPAALLISVLSILLLSYLSWRFVEQPFRKKDFALLDDTKLLALPALAAASYFFGPSANTLVVPAQPVELTRYADSSLICHSKILDSCNRGDPDGDVDVLIMGDSHAAMLNYFADEIGISQGIRFTVITSSACVPIPGDALDSKSGEKRENCQRQTDEVLERLDSFDSVIIAGYWTAHGQQDDFVQDLKRFLSANADPRRPTIVLSQVPELVNNPQRSYRFASLGLPIDVKLRQSGYQQGNEAIEQIASETSFVEYLDLTESDVFKDIPFHDGTIMFFDTHHLNEYGSKVYGGASAAAIAELMSSTRLAG